MKNLFILTSLVIILSSLVLSIDSSLLNGSNISVNTKSLPKLNLSDDLSTPLPDSLKLPSKIIFGIKDETLLTVQYVSSAFFLWLFIFFMFLEFLSVTSFNKITQYIISLGLILFLGIIGLINTIIHFLFSIFNKMGFFGFIIFIAVLTVLFLILKKVIKIVQHKREVKAAEQRGVQESVNRKKIENFVQDIDDTSRTVSEGSNP
jgi:hypothetical protein